MPRAPHRAARGRRVCQALPALGTRRMRRRVRRRQRRRRRRRQRRRRQRRHRARMSALLVRVRVRVAVLLVVSAALPVPGAALCAAGECPSLGGHRARRARDHREARRGGRGGSAGRQWRPFRTRLRAGLDALVVRVRQGGALVVVAGAEAKPRSVGRAAGGDAGVWGDGAERASWNRRRGRRGRRRGRGRPGGRGRGRRRRLGGRGRRRLGLEAGAVERGVVSVQELRQVGRVGARPEQPRHEEGQGELLVLDALGPRWGGRRQCWRRRGWRACDDLAIGASVEWLRKELAEYHVAMPVESVALGALSMAEGGAAGPRRATAVARLSTRMDARTIWRRGGRHGWGLPWRRRGRRRGRRDGGRRRGRRRGRRDGGRC